MENSISDKIDQYLDNKMNVEEKLAFEKELSSNETLRQQVEIQTNLRQGIERLNLKSNISSQFKKMTIKNKIYKWGVATIAIAAIGTASYFGYQQVNGGNNYELPALNEEGKPVWADADKNLPTQLFSIDPTKDTVLETEGGIVFAVPAGAFLGANGTVTLEVREALNPLDIINGGLSTTSDGNLLETGGMFYLNARSGEQSLKINPEKPVYANVPANEIKPGMMLFTGERKPDGSINWKNPKPMEKQLIPVDINTLDFYPKGFREKVAELGFNANDKRVTDSIYYSYSGRPYLTRFLVVDNYLEDTVKYIITERINKTSPQAISNEDTLKLVGEYTPPKALLDTTYHVYEVNPARISAIWNNKFQNTIIATKEFEERLQAIFKHGSFDVLDLYINNLNKKMYEIDSMAAFGVDAYRPEFEAFYLRHDGGIAIKENHMKKLQEYFNKKRTATELAAQKTYNERIAKETKADKTHNDVITKQSQNDAKRESENFQHEYDVNLNEAYKQLGIEKFNPPANAYYAFAIPATGWNNVDKYVLESTVSRTTLDYTDPNSGKKAVIKYEALSITVENESNYEHVKVYLIPDSLNSFMRVNKKGAAYEENLNELFKYTVVVVAQKGKKWFWVQQTNTKPGATTVILNAIDETELRVNLDYSFTKRAGQDFRNDLDAMIENHEYSIQLKQRQKQEEIDAAIMPVIFPFYSTATPFGMPVSPAPGVN
jgi:hypothetical protein